MASKPPLGWTSCQSCHTPGKSDLPVEEPLAVGDGTSVVPQGLEFRCRSLLVTRLHIIDGPGTEGEEFVGIL